MLTRVYADNFKCFQNLNVSFDELVVIMGRNGSGKSSLLDALVSVRALVCRFASVTEAFPSAALCRWDKRSEMSFELDVRLPDPLVEGSSMDLNYSVAIEHEISRGRARISRESLTFESEPLFRFEGGTAYLFRDDLSAGPFFEADWSRSCLGTVGQRNDNRRLFAFRDFLGNLLVIRPDPHQIGSEAKAEEHLLSVDCANFASWYRYLSQEHQGRVSELTSQLREVIAGFQWCRLREAGLDTKALAVNTRDEGAAPEIEFLFHELSDGQRALIVLNTLLYGTPPGTHVLIIDEPTNCLALSEVQPWLMDLRDSVGVTVPQAIIVSHHPEVLDYLGPDHAVLFERSANGPTMVRYGLPDDSTGLTVSERVARGWLDG